MKNTKVLMVGKTLLFATFFLLISFAIIKHVNAATGVVSVRPASVEIPEPNQTFIVDLNITDVDDLFGYEIMLWYKNDVLQALDVERPSGHILEPTDSANQFQAKWETKNDFNATHGRIWISFMLLSPETGRSGSGILARVTFNSTNTGTTPLVLNNYPGTQGPIKLASYPAGTPIAHTANDGAVTVIPEFSIKIIFPLLLLTSLIAIAIANLARSRKHLQPTTTNRAH